jgi:hypothetical protein
MADVKRYSLYVGEDYHSRMVEIKYGAYVEYDDYKALEAKYNALIDKDDLWRAEYWQKRCEQMESDKTDARLLIVKMSRLLTRILSLYELAYDDVHDARIFIEDAQKYEFEE